MEVNVIKFDHFGRGIALINEKVVFIEKALPKEILDIKIVKNKSKYSEAVINKIIKKNESRQEPVCPYYSLCGGCNFLHVDYTFEKEFKINKAKELLGRCDNFYYTKISNYRNKVVLHIKNNEIGFYKEKTNELINIKYCYLLDNNINKVIDDLNKIDKSKIKEVIIKSNNNSVLLNIKGEVSDLNVFDYIDTVIINNQIIKGNGYLEEVIDNKIFKITSDAFFQVNKDGLLKLYMILKRYLKNKKINEALDLYSGTSLWGILISDYVNNVTGIEINHEAYLNALDNIKKNNIRNISLINGDVSNYINQFNDIDLVIVDPPRSGLDKKTREYLKKIKAKYFIYISCDMYTLKRDINDLSNIYKISEINLVDMFPRTYHVETVCLLCQKSVDK